MSVCILGTGYVGLVSGACFASIGHKVTCVDINQEKIKKLNKGISPIYEIGLERIIKKEKDKNIFFTTNIEDAIRENDFIFIAVGTPPKKNGDADLKYIFNCAELISKNLENNNSKNKKIIITKSTVPVGTGKKIKNIILNNKNNKNNFEICSNPEFLREGNAVYDFLNPDRIIVGTENKPTSEKIKKLYQKIINKNKCEYFSTNIETAELIKYSSNAFLATKITFINEIANLCEATGADVQDVAFGMGLDKRIGKDFLNAGPGYGGSCFPKDTNAISYLGKELNAEQKIISTVIETNKNRKNYLIKKIKNIFKRQLNSNLKNKKICILGSAFKNGTDDLRDSPAIEIIKLLLKEKVEINLFDPEALANTKEVFGDKINYFKDEYSSSKNCDCLLILTEWKQFSKLDLEKIKNNLRNNLIIDFRNILPISKIKKNKINYFSIGQKEITFD